jgi:hypothetical protein
MLFGRSKFLYKIRKQFNKTMRFKFIAAFVYAGGVNIFLWLYLIAFSGVYPKSGGACILTSVLSYVIYFGAIQPLIPIFSGMFRALAIKGKNG